MNQGPYAGIGLPRGSSSVSSNARAAEAELLAQATKTAIVAARSILMSGGSEDVALKTAKAAAESVLNPCSSDNDTIAGRGTSFLRRRKIKRQAEVVASMALTTAANNVRNGISTDWSESNPGSHINLYARNITTRSMNTQDEPSVLSGSTRPPLGQPVDPSQKMQSMQSRHGPPSPKMFILTEHMGKTNENPQTGPAPLNAQVSSLTNSKYTQRKNTDSHTDSSHDEDIPTENINPAARRSPMASNMKPPRNPESRVVQTVSPPKYNVHTTERSGGHDGSVNMPITHVGPSRSRDDDEFDDDTTLNDRSVWTAQTRQNPWKDFDPLLSTVTTVFNMLTCTPLGPVDPHSSASENNQRGIPKRITHDTEFDTIASAVDTIDDAETEITGNEFRSMDSYDNTEAKSRLVGSTSSGDSSSSADSCSMIQDMQSTSYSEGEINVRSSIRDTMERVVAISKKGLKHNSPEDQKWLSYEAREGSQLDSSKVGTPRSKSKRNPVKVFITPKSKKKFFFNKRATLKK